MATHVNAEFTADDLQDKAIQLNPNVGYCDLLNCAKQEVWGLSDDATIGFLSRAMITHCRVSMAGYYGYCVHVNRVHLPCAPVVCEILVQICDIVLQICESCVLFMNSWSKYVAGHGRS